jgi:glutaredoxin 3
MSVLDTKAFAERYRINSVIEMIGMNLRSSESIPGPQSKGRPTEFFVMSEVTIYTTNTCPYCVAAKNLLKAKGVSYNEINVQTSMDQRNIMMERSGRRTVPQIFIGEHHVGGFDDMALLERKGELNALLAG